MRRKRILLFICILTQLSTSQAQVIRVATFNVRYDNPRDSGNLWINRAPVVANLIRFHDFDIFGTQEGLKHQLDYIGEALPYYSRHGVGRDDGKDKGEHSQIFFKKERFALLKAGDFWLSETPGKPSLGWDATCCNRICSWVYLQDKKTKKKFYFFNAHFDHQGVVARKESSKLVLKKIREIVGSSPVIFTGDLNGDQKSEWYLHLANSDLLKDSFKETPHPYANNASFNAFGATVNRKEIIDHIFISRHFKIRKWGILTDTYHGKYPSDHFPVISEVAFK